MIVVDCQTGKATVKDSPAMEEANRQAFEADRQRQKAEAERARRQEAAVARLRAILAERKAHADRAQGEGGGMIDEATLAELILDVNGIPHP